MKLLTNEKAGYISVTNESTPLLPVVSQLGTPLGDVLQHTDGSEASPPCHLACLLPGLTSHVVTMDGFAVAEDARCFSAWRQ